jgi:hypothetical protein
MLIDVISYLFSQGITALPLHDAVIVAESYAEQARSVMQHEFERRAGPSGGIVKVKIMPN